MTGAIGCRYYGRDFTAGEMALLRALIAGPPPLNRHMLSKEFCRRIGWFKPDGGLKDMMARVTTLAMHRDGLIALPAPQGRQNRPGPIVFGSDTEPPLFPAPTYPFRQAVMARTGRGGERPHCAEIRHLRAANSAANRTMPRADGTITPRRPSTSSVRAKNHR